MELLKDPKRVKKIFGKPEWADILGFYEEAVGEKIEFSMHSLVL
jgi:hypothetical protein